jgi:hypothetical protein
MSRSDKPASTTKNSSIIFVIGGIIWAFLAAMFFLIYGAGVAEASDTYALGTAIFEIVAYFAAAVLCLRNAVSSHNVSGKGVWIGLGGGMALYCIGSCLYTYWEVVLKFPADVSPADFFYVLSYLFLIYGMLRAVLARELNLEPRQWAIVLGVGVIAVMAAIYVNTLAAATKAEMKADWSLIPPAIAQATPAAKPATAPLKATPKATPAVPTTAPPSATPTATPSATPSVSPSILPTPAAPAIPANAPGWAKGFLETFKKYEDVFNWIYVVADACLLTIATALLTAFWGGRFSQSWRMIAFANFSLYLADMWVKYMTKTQGDAYKSGSLPEVFFVFAGVLFAIGAVLEYDLSKSRRTSRRRAQ